MHDQPTRFIKSLLIIAVFLKAGSISFAQNKKIDSLLITLENEKSEVAKLPILRELSQSFTSVDVDKKYIYARQMLKIAKKYQIDSVIPIAILDMAMVHGIKTHYDSSMYYFTKGLAIAQSKKVDSQEARAYVGIGYTFDRLYNPKAAIENYELALKIYKKIGHKKGLNQAIINLGSIYFDSGDYKIAESYFRQALNSYEKLKDQSGIAHGNFILGNVNRALNKNADALKYYFKSLAIREKTGDLNGTALTNFGLGELYLKEGKFQKAEKSFKKAIDLNRTLNFKYQEALALTGLAKVYLKSNDLENALKIGEGAKKVAKEIMAKSLEVDALIVLIEVRKSMNDYKGAFDNQTEANIIKDSLDVKKRRNEFILADFRRIRTENSSLEKTNEIISNKNLTYERAIYTITSLLILVLVLLFLYLRKIKQKNKINCLLENQKKEITNINHKLESANEELLVQNNLTHLQKNELERINAVKNKFFSIVAHDLRSPIVTLKMLFNSYFSGYLTQEEMNMLLKKLEENIFNTADFLENLLEWSKSQLEGMIVNPESFLVKTLIDRNLKILNAQLLAKNLSIENGVDENSNVFADNNMLNVVFRNLISNSIKFCREGDSIHIYSTVSDGKTLITIRDTGIGIDVEEQKKIFKLEHIISHGTSVEKGHHIGLVLCKDMVEQNNGKIWFESKVGVGTTFFIEISENDPVHNV
jgi:signal transduction histidine kinase/Tfp pilus assembly protein PilF